MPAFASPPLHFPPLPSVSLSLALSLSIFLRRPSFRIWRGPEGKIFIRSQRPVLVSQVASPVCLVQAKITHLRDSFIGFSSSFVPGWYGNGTEPKTLGSDNLDTRTQSILPLPLSLCLSLPTRAPNGPTKLKDRGPGFSAQKDLNQSRSRSPFSIFEINILQPIWRQLSNITVPMMIMRLLFI